MSGTQEQEEDALPSAQNIHTIPPATPTHGQNQPIYYYPAQYPSPYPVAQPYFFPHPAGYRQQSQGPTSSNSQEGPSPSTEKSKRAYLTSAGKIEEILSKLQQWRWSVGDLMAGLFLMKDPNNGKDFKASERHTQMVTKFLTGETCFRVGHFLDAWAKGSYGLPPIGHKERDLMTPDSNYLELRYARPTLACFAMTMVQVQLEKEVKRVSRKDGGLHTFTSSKGDNASIAHFEAGPGTFDRTMELFRVATPVAWTCLSILAGQRESDRRHPEYVVTHALSTLVYSYNQYAKLLPLEKGILNFACRANHYLHKYDSRVGNAPSYHSIYEALKKLSAHDAEIIRELISSGIWSCVLRLDNIQHYVRPRNFGLGRESMMKLGCAGTIFEFLDFHPSIVDLNDKKARLLENKRKDLTYTGLLELIDFDHLGCVSAIQWLRVLVNFVPCLEPYKKHVSRLYETEGAKMRLKPRKTRLFPLPTNGYNETITSELLKAVLDFMETIGYSEGSHPGQLIFVGGDGLTYERLVQLKLYLQFHDTEWQRLEWLQPFLETWHTCWTDLSRIYEAHWDDSLSRDPSSIGHNATLLKRKKPSDLKKVDYYPYSELAYSILDARILDCWRVFLTNKDGDLLSYFEAAKESESLPSIEELYETAKNVYRRYGHPHAFEFAVTGFYGDPDVTVPAGASWIPSQTEVSSSMLGESSTTKAKGKSKKSEKTENNLPNPPPFVGDQTLAQSCRFLYDATISRELIYATAEGDVGRVWEAMKALVLTFAGSSHNKYTSYLLEMICDLELESSAQLREAFLANWIINPSGQAGRFVAGDKFQEQLQDEMYEHIGRKDRGFDEDYMRKVIAPNAYRFVQVKKTVTDGLGLARRAGKHTTPSTDPVIVKLLEVYRESQLHLFRKGRTYGGDVRRTDDLGRGQDALSGKKLENWVKESTRVRNLHLKASAGQAYNTPSAETQMEDLDKDLEASNGIVDDGEGREPITRGRYVQTEDGDLAVEYEGEQEGDDVAEGLEDISIE